MRLLCFNLVTDVNNPVLGFACRWIAKLSKHVDAIDVITMQAGQFELPENVWVYSVGKEKGYSELRRAIRFYRILLRLLRQHQYDGCFAHMMPVFALMGAPLLRVKRIPIILWYTHKSVPLILRLATMMVDRVVTASQESFRIPNQKVRVIGHGIETDRFMPQEGCNTAEMFTILTVSRLSRIKRINLLIEAVALINQRNPEVSFCLKIVGGPATAQDYSYIEKLKRQVENAHLQDIVSFEGSIPFEKILPYYQQADCFVNLSPTGGLDKAVLEAMSCEVVSLVTNQTFVSVFGKDLADLLVVEENSNAVCAALLQVAFMPKAARQEFGTQLREIVVRDHNLSTLCHRLVNEFREVQNRA